MAVAKQDGIFMDAHNSIDAEPTDRRVAPRKKLVIEVPNILYERILAICATRGIPVNQAVREVLERTFPSK